MAAVAPDAMMAAPHDAVTAEAAPQEPPRPSFLKSMTMKSGSFGSVGGGAQKKRRRSSSQIAPISSPEDMDDLSRKLQASKQAGQLARVRISGTCLAVGVVAFCGGLGLKMGSSIEDVELCFVHPELANETASAHAVIEYFEKRFDSCDVRTAECSDSEFRERLLAIIEAGFGASPRPPRLRACLFA